MKRLFQAVELFFGNAAIDHFGRGWVLGSFVEPANDIRAIGAVEGKWSSHRGGNKRAASRPAV
jgi:hypothetical protein